MRTSVIVPAYSIEAYIGECLESVRRQTDPDFEVIVIDDASTDRTAAIVERAGQDDPRIRLIRNPANAGPSRARNLGIAAARGEWVAFLDGDDWWLPDRLATLLAEAERHGADLVADDFGFYQDGATTPYRTMLPPGFTAPRLLGIVELLRRDRPGRYDFGLLKLVARTAFLREHGLVFDEAVRYSEDFLFLIHCLAAGARLLVVPSAHYCYRVRPGSRVSEQSDRDFADMLALNAALAALFPGSANREVTALFAARGAEIDRQRRYQGVVGALKRGRLGQALRRLASDIRLWPFFAGTLLLSARRRLAARFAR